MAYRLHLNENNLCKNNRLIKKIFTDETSICQYSSKKCNKTKELIAQYYNISKNNIVVFNGLEEAIFYTALFASLKKDGAIVTTEKTYNTINLSATLLEEKLIEFPLLNNKIDIDMMCNNIKNYLNNGGKISLCYICNPHNPTGTLLSGNLSNLLDLAKENGFIVFVDQAYIELVEHEDKLQQWLSCEQIILGRTFSKTYGLAGLRCGYTITTNKDFLNWTNSVNEILLYKENKINVAAIKSVLFDENPIEYTRKTVNANRKQLEQIFATYGIHYINSCTNFILFQPPCSAEEFIEYAEEKFDVLLSNAKELDWHNYVRITISSCDIVSIMKKMLFQMKQDGLFNK